MSTIAPRRRRANLTPRLLLIPAIAVLLLGMGYPVVWQIVTSTQEYGLAQQFGQPAPFVGLENYLTLATNGGLWAVVARSLVFCIVTAFVTLAIGTLLALLMTAITKGARLVLQVALLLAWSMPVVAAMTVWIWLFDNRRGVINYLLDLIPGVEMNRYDWLATPLTFFIVASVIVIWVNTRRSQMSCSSRTIEMTGRIIGRMMPQKRCQPFAPSSWAASMTSSETWVSPA